MMKSYIRKLFSRPNLTKLGYVLLVSLPIIAYIFRFSISNRHGIFRGEDWDYFAQSYEAARQSIVHYHQFPWWNPWMNGGQPLFANPQFGLFSIQMPLVLLFGTVAGLHYAILIYLLLGFWGMYRLLLRLGCQSKLIAITLSYIWVFSGFNAWHLAGGHFTFAIYLLAPWAFLTTLNINKKRGWLWFGLIASLLLLSAAHYLTIETLVICGLLALIQIARQIHRKHIRSFKPLFSILKPYLLSSLLIFVLCAFRLVYTLQFTNQYPRLEPLDPAVSIKLFIAALTFRHAVDPGLLTKVGITNYGWTEYANYFGLLTLGLFSYFVIRRLESLESMSSKERWILIAIFISALLSLGSFSGLSPFSLLHRLPVFNQMRVPSRFICWFGLGVILFLARLPKKPIIYALLIVSVLDVFAAGYPILNYHQPNYTQKSVYTNNFQQHEFFQTDPAIGQMNIIFLENFRLLRATQQNYGEVYGYEPILNVAEYYYLPKPVVCGINQGCSFVRTKNAVVIYWSPNQITLKRTGSGPINLNMNPGKVWQVNGKAIFSDYRILELQKNFMINDPENDITVTLHPAL